MNPRKGSRKLGTAKSATATKASGIKGGAQDHAKNMAKIQGGEGYGVAFAPKLKSS